jgi:hypothetical protein
MVIVENHRGGHASGAEHAASGGDEDRTLEALDALVVVLDKLSDDHRRLSGMVQELRRARAGGQAWKDVIFDEGEPGSMQLLSEMLGYLSKASGSLRKELVEELRQEGVSIPAIARLLGVTHQRISNLLRRKSY